MQNSLLRQMMDSGIVDFSLVTFSISMSPAMFSQVTTLSEPSLAYITLIWLLSGVYSHVSYHYILNSGKRVIKVSIIFFLNHYTTNFTTALTKNPLTKSGLISV